MSTIDDFDAIVIGAGMAGASVAYFLARQARVLVLEREDYAGYHTTGRSAALFSETYGSPQVRALTRATRPFLQAPPAGFAAHRLLSPRGALVVASEVDEARLRDDFDTMRPFTADLAWLDSAAVRERVPVLREASAHAGFLEPRAADIDVHELHQGFLRGVREQQGVLRLNADVREITRGPGHWLVEAGQHRYRAPLLLNAAGAWVDQIAALAGVAPIGIEPRRRSAFLFEAPKDVATSDWPFVTDIGESFYFKPDAGLLLGSPANVDPDMPHDVHPEELDIALGIYRIEEATTMTIRRPTRTWAGLRSFVADGDLVGGFAIDAEGFFWVAGQGGYGIQTSAAMGEACAALAQSQPLPAHLADAGVTAAMLDPRRLTSSQ